MGACVFGGCTQSVTPQRKCFTHLDIFHVSILKSIFNSFWKCLEMNGNYFANHIDNLSPQRSWLVGLCWPAKTESRWFLNESASIRFVFLLFQYHWPDYFLLLLFWCGVLLFSICCNHLDFNLNTCLCWWMAFSPAQTKDLSHSVFASSKAQT